MRKWTITVLVVVALAALGFYARIWLPKVVPLLSNHENADTLKSIVSLVQITLWIVAALAFMFNLWRPKKKADDPPSPAAIKSNQQSGAGADRRPSKGRPSKGGDWIPIRGILTFIGSISSRFPVEKHLPKGTQSNYIWPPTRRWPTETEKSLLWTIIAAQKPFS